MDSDTIVVTKPYFWPAKQKRYWLAIGQFETDKQCKKKLTALLC